MQELFENDGEDEYLEKYQLREFDIEPLSGTKIKAFAFFHSLTPKTPFPALFAIILIIVSFTQLLVMLLSKEGGVEKHTEQLTIVNILHLIEDSRSAFVYWFCLYFATIFVFFYSFLLVMTYNYPKGSSANFARLLLVPLYWILMIPITLILLSLWDCDNDSKNFVLPEMTCWGFNHFVHLSLNIGTLILWFFIIVITTFVSTFSHAHNNNPFSHFHWNFEVIYTIMRLLLILKIWPVFSGNMEVYVNFVINVCVFVYFLSLVVYTFPYYHPTISWMFSSSAISVGVIALYDSALQIFNFFRSTPSEDTKGIEDIEEIEVNPLPIAIIAFLIVVLTMAVQTRRIYKLIMETKPTVAEEVDRQANIFMSGLVTKTNGIGISTTTLAEVAKMHKAGNILRTKSTEVCSIETKESENLAYSLFVAYLLQRDTAYENSAVIVSLSMVYLHLIKNIHMAYATIARIEDSELGYPLQFAVFCARKSIYTKIKKERFNWKKKGYAELSRVLTYETRYSSFCSLLEKAVSIRSEFWNNLLQLPNLNFLHKQGLLIMEANNELNASWDKLNSAYPNEAKTLTLYAAYLNTVVGSVDEAEALEKRLMDAVNEQNNRELHISKLFARESASIIISTHKQSHSKIIQASSNIKNIFGYSRKTLIHKSLAMLMPRIIGKNHEEFMSSYMLTGKRNSSNVIIETFGLHREGYIFPIRVAFQQIFSLKFGFYYVGNISLDEVNIGSNYIITGMRGKIEGISSEMGKILKIQPNLLAEQKILIQHFCSEITNSNVSTIQGMEELHFSIEGAYEASQNLLQQMRENPVLNKAFKSRKTFLMNDKPITGFSGKCEIGNIVHNSLKFGMKVFKFPYLKIKQENSGNKDAINGLMSKDILNVLPEVKIPVIYECLQPMQSNNQTLRMPKKSRFSQKELRKLTQTVYSNNKRGKNNQEEDSNEAREESKQNSSKFLNSPKRSELDDIDEEKEGATTKMSRQEETDFGLLASASIRNMRPKVRVSLSALVPSQTNKSTDSQSTTTKARIKKKVKILGKQRYENFYPTSVKRLKYILMIFTLMLFTIISIRIGITIYMDEHFVVFNLALSLNAERLSAFSIIGKSIRELSLYTIKDESGQPIINDTLRISQFDYGSLLPTEIRSKVSSYKDYLIQTIKLNVQRLNKWDKQTVESLSYFSKDNAALVNPVIPVYYPDKANKAVAKEYFITLRTAFLNVLAQSEIYVANIEENTLKENSFEQQSLLNHTLWGPVRGAKYARDGIFNECKKIQQMQVSITNALLISVIVTLGCSVIVVFPFLIIVNKQLSNMLLLLVKISKDEIKNQFEKCLKFVTVLRDNMRIDDSEEALEEMVIWNDPEENKQKADDVDESKPLKGEIKETTKIPLSQTSSGEIKLEEGISEKYVPYANNSWKILFVFTIFSGILMGIYAGYSTITSSLGEAINYQIDEQFYTASAVYYNGMMISYLNNYIVSNKTGMCGVSLCASYLPTLTIQRISELNNLLINHRTSKAYMSDSYNQLFSDVLEKNPCDKIPYFRNISLCSTFMGGIFTLGANLANIQFSVYQGEIVKDFAVIKSPTIEDIKGLVNDIRIINMGILIELLIIPAYRMLSDAMVKDSMERKENNISIAYFFFCLLIAVLSFISLLGGSFLLQSLRRLIYDTKSLLSSLPYEIIQQNKPIMTFLTDHS